MDSPAPARIPSSVASQPPWPRPGYAWYVVGVLLLAYTLSFIDRMILSLLVEPIRATMQISDTQVSLLLGLAFALFYTLLGLPLAWVADKKSRRNLIIAGIAIWTVMTAGCGFAGSYAILFLMRMGVGVGEATLSPAAYSMLSDYFPRDKLARAISVYSIGVPLGSGVALVLGAFVVKAALAAPMINLPGYGAIEAWRLIFVLVAVPGPLICLLMFTVREPLRRGRLKPLAEEIGDDVGSTLSLKSHLVSHRGAIGAIFAAMSLIGLVMYGTLAWIPTFFSRTYGMNTASAGFWFGIIMALSGCGGLLLGGTLADHLYRKGFTDAHLRTMLLSVVLGGPLLVAAPLMPNATFAFAILGPALLLMTMHGVGSVALQLITPNELRARVTALYFFLVNLIGLGLGPTSIALITDHVFHKDVALRYSLAVMSAVALPVAAVILLLGLKSYARSLAQAVSDHDALEPKT